MAAVLPPPHMVEPMIVCGWDARRVHKTDYGLMLVEWARRGDFQSPDPKKRFLIWTSDRAGWRRMIEAAETTNTVHRAYLDECHHIEVDSIEDVVRLCMFGTPSTISEHMEPGEEGSLIGGLVPNG